MVGRDDGGASASVAAVFPNDRRGTAPTTETPPSEAAPADDATRIVIRHFVEM